MKDKRRCGHCGQEFINPPRPDSFIAHTRAVHFLCGACIALPMPEPDLSSAQAFSDWYWKIVGEKKGYLFFARIGWPEGYRYCANGGYCKATAFPMMQRDYPQYLRDVAARSSTKKSDN